MTSRDPQTVARYVRPGSGATIEKVDRKTIRRLERACGNPPATPTGVVLSFQATEARTHLRFTGKVKFNEVTTDDQGHATRVARYEVQLRATTVAGVPVETEDGRTRLRLRRRAPARRVGLETATNPSGTIFRFVTRKPHGLAVGDNTKVEDCKNPSTYNGTYAVVTVVNTTTFEVTGSAGVAACSDPGIVVDDDDRLHVITGELPRPRTWYWQTRVRGVDNHDCRGDWSAWTSPLLPWTGADPTPPAPTGLVLDFDKVQKARGARWMGRLQWNEVVNFDYPGTPADDETDVSSYAWQVQISEDGVIGDDYKIGGKRPAKDADADTFVRQRFPVRNKRWWFRARVRTIDRFNRRSAWTAYTSWQRPGNEAPPSPTAVTIFDKANLSVPVQWVGPDDPTDPDLISVDVEGFQADWSTSPTFASSYRRDRYVKGERARLRIPKTDLGPFYYARVRSFNSDGEKSAWIPATLTGNSSAGAPAIGVKPGRSQRIAVPFNVTNTVEAKQYPQGWTADGRYTIVGVRARCGRHDAATHPDDGTPGGAEMQINVRIEDDAGTSIAVFTTETRLRIEAGTHKDSSWIIEGDAGFGRTYIDLNETAFVKVFAVGSTRPGSNLGVFLILEADE